ncbi:MAG: hypothetical protein KOO60_00135 [Gemmatimonadales bacterium]|nr:hypothetical protein [Gemmatimonadales bacterium]
MKTKSISVLLVLMALLFATVAMAQDEEAATELPDVFISNGNGVCQFVDEDGDGFNDLAPDADGDGIPNGLDPDYAKLEDGTGSQWMWGQDEDFDGHMGEGEAGSGPFQYGPGDGEGDGPYGPGVVGDGDGEGSYGDSDDSPYGPGDGVGDGGFGPGEWDDDTEDDAQGRQDRGGTGSNK